MELSRRQFLEAAGAAGVAATVDPGRFAQRPDGPNVVLVMIDTLRADYVGAYGGRARTPAIDALARDSLRFTRFYPEAMATVPARRSVMTGRRVFPFRNWHVHRGLMSSPGWAPIADVRDTWTSALRRSGWWTAYVTDNPFIGFSSFYRPFRSTLQPLRRDRGPAGPDGPPVDGVAQPARPVARARAAPAAHPQARAPVPRGGGRYWEDESRSWAARTFKASAGILEQAARHQPFATGGGHLRAARAVDAAARLHRQVRRPRLPRARALHGALRARYPSGSSPRAARRCSAACATCMRPRSR